MISIKPEAVPQPFRPAAPEETDRWPSFYDMFFGETARNPLVGWPREVFEVLNRKTRLLHLTYHGISDPEGVKHVLLDNHANYTKPRLIRDALAPAIGEGLLTAEGDLWREQRKLMAPIFTPATVKSFLPIFVDQAKASAGRWKSEGPGRRDMAIETTHTTFDIINAALFSGEAGLDPNEARPHLEAAVSAPAEYRLGFLFGMPWLDQSPLQRRGRTGTAYLVSKAAALVRRRQADPHPGKDFMGRVLSAFADRYPPEQAAKLAVDNALTFMVAGHETTSNGLAWALYLLSQDLKAQDWAREEAIEAWAASDDPSEILDDLPYLKMVWEETLRLYPPVPRIDREALADDIVCGERVRKGEMISIWPWVMHRHRKLWNEPDLFNPENFDPEAKAEHHRFQYIPFGAGPHVCIGMPFAQAEALILLSYWLTRFTFRPAPDHRVFPTAHVTLRPLGGMPLVIEALR